MTPPTVVLCVILGCLCISEIAGQKWYVYTTEEEPFTMTKNAAKLRRGENKFEGYFVDVWTKIANHIDKDWQIKISDTMVSGKDGSFTGALGQARRSPDTMVAGPVLITSQTNHYFTLSTPLFATGISAVRRKAPTKWHVSVSSHLRLVLKPFTWKVWVAVVVSALLTGLLMFLLRRFTQTEAPDSNCADAFWWIFRVVSTEGNNSQSTPIAMRIASVTWFCFMLTLGIIYAAIMVNQIPTSVKGDVTNGTFPIKNIRDLASQKKVKFGVVKGGHAATFLSTSPETPFQKMYAAIESAPEDYYVNSSAEGFAKVRESNGDYIFIDDNHFGIEREIGKKDCEMEKVGSLVTGDALALVVPSSNRAEINIAILTMKESGELDELYRKWFVERSKCYSKRTGRKVADYYDDDDDDDDDKEPPTADIGAVIGPLIMLAFGYLISVVACIITRVGRCCHGKKHKGAYDDCQMQDK